MRIAAIAAAACLLVLTTGVARADAVTWNYVGNPFSYGLNAGLIGDSLDASVTFNGPLPANAFDQDLSADIVSWQVSDSAGIFSFTSSDGVSTLSGAFFTTDANGNILSNFGHEPDAFEVSSGDIIDPLRLPVCINGTCESFDQAFFGLSPIGTWFAGITSGATPIPPSTGMASAADSLTQSGATASDAAFFPGVWTEAAAVPEPASLALLGTALAGLGLFRRRRRNA